MPREGIGLNLYLYKQLRWVSRAQALVDHRQLYGLAPLRASEAADLCVASGPLHGACPIELAHHIHEQWRLTPELGEAAHVSAVGRCTEQGCQTGEEAHVPGSQLHCLDARLNGDTIPHL